MLDELQVSYQLGMAWQEAIGSAALRRELGSFIGGFF